MELTNDKERQALWNACKAARIELDEALDHQRVASQAETAARNRVSEARKAYDKARAALLEKVPEPDKVRR